MNNQLNYKISTQERDMIKARIHQIIGGRTYLEAFQILRDAVDAYVFFKVPTNGPAASICLEIDKRPSSFAIQLIAEIRKDISEHVIPMPHIKVTSDGFFKVA